MDTVSLSDVAGGELQVKAERAIQDVMKNLKDTNTPWKNKREVKITLKFTQNEERDDVTCDISVENKLASAKPTSTKFAIEQDLDTGEVVAVEYGPNVRGQMSFDDVEVPKSKTTTVDGQTVDTETGEIVGESAGVIDFQAKQA